MHKESTYSFIELERGLSIGTLRYRPDARPQNLDQNPDQDNDRLLLISLSVQGLSRHSSAQQTGHEYRSADDAIISTRISTSSEGLGFACSPIHKLRIVARESLIERYMGYERCHQLFSSAPLANGLSCRAGTPPAMSHACTLIALARFNLDPRTPLNLHIHALSLLQEQLNLFAPAHNSLPLPFTSPDIRYVEEARLLMQNNLQAALPLEELASQVGVGKRRLRTLMSYFYGKTPGQLLLELRMNRALRLIEANTPTHEIAWQLGYRGVRSFATVFTSYHGVTPESVQRLQVNA
ncbi:TPA: helix-turn-helix transcriptional regulator [Pseudomonas aeruginosa]|nr:helix-turn-helix transcriptional regulator [Pseudomonas aeruginosa]HEP8786140.1 helix-turn-helix transcriptional regulator [Pseudomonas aeruginosa]